jgi:hypothetical protein
LPVILARELKRFGPDQLVVISLIGSGNVLRQLVEAPSGLVAVLSFENMCSDPA